MKKILISFAAIISLLIVTVCILALRRPDVMRVSRSLSIGSSSETAFGIVNDFRRWDEWSPWSRLDPAMKKTLEGPPEGVGAIYKWSGNSEVGEGATHLIESKPFEKVGMKIVFLRPFAGEADVQLTFESEGNGTKVTWSMQSPQPFPAKLASVFIDTEKLCGDQFAEGLQNLKRVAEAAR